MKLETAAAEQIAKIDWPVVVVSVVGLNRTGKSYLMNSLADSTKKFVLGDTIESTTEGIWVWCKIHPEKSNTVLLLLGTKGVGDDEKSYGHVIVIAVGMLGMFVSAHAGWNFMALHEKHKKQEEIRILPA